MYSFRASPRPLHPPCPVCVLEEIQFREGEWNHGQHPVFLQGSQPPLLLPSESPSEASVTPRGLWQLLPTVQDPRAGSHPSKAQASAASPQLAGLCGQDPGPRPIEQRGASTVSVVGLSVTWGFVSVLEQTHLLTPRTPLTRFPWDCFWLPGGQFPSSSLEQGVSDFGGGDGQHFKALWREGGCVGCINRGETPACGQCGARLLWCLHPGCVLSG